MLTSKTKRNVLKISVLLLVLFCIIVGTGVTKTSAKTTPTDTNYKLLAPLPDGSGDTMKNFESDPGCTTDSKGSTTCTNPCAFGKYMNIVIKFFLGICAVLAMIMIFYGGITYMTSELISEKSAGRQTITNALFGLLIALGAYILLFTINPDLLNLCLDQQLPQETMSLTSFTVSGPLLPTETSAPVKVSFDKEAYPAAKIASQKTGVKTALILAIFKQETTNGVNLGHCTINSTRVKDKDKAALQTIIGELNMDINKTNVSCALSSGYGGAIGYTQFMPSTWIQYRGEAGGYLGHTPSPWNASDALMMTAVYLKHIGGVENPHTGACNYFGQCSFSGVDYGSQVIEKMNSIQQQIDAEIKAGTLS